MRSQNRKQTFLHNRYFLTLYLIAGVISISLFFLWYSQSLINKIKQNERRYVNLYAKILTETTKISDGHLNLFFEHVIDGINFPVIVTSEDGIIASKRNIDRPIEKCYELLDEMDKLNPPIEIEIERPGDEPLIQHLHYGESAIIARLKWYSILLVFFSALFSGFGLWLYITIKGYEQSHIWVGMAKETAHQLGTPVSSLMGWIELLKDYIKSHDENESNNVIKQMSIDIKRLEQISERFNKIGNSPKLQPININVLVYAISNYFRKRLPNFSKNIDIKVNYDHNVPDVSGNKTLIEWALENIVKNAIDAIDKQDGVIEITTAIDRNNDNRINIIIKDNGKGIPKAAQHKIFTPGYSTKKIGWGLGLTLVKRIIEEYHSGKVHVKESMPGRGTAIQITVNKFNVS